MIFQKRRDYRRATRELKEAVKLDANNHQVGTGNMGVWTAQRCGLRHAWTKWEQKVCLGREGGLGCGGTGAPLSPGPSAALLSVNPAARPPFIPPTLLASLTQLPLPLPPSPPPDVERDGPLLHEHGGHPGRSGCLPAGPGSQARPQGVLAQHGTGGKRREGRERE
jgi:hypothetical protein